MIKSIVTLYNRLSNRTIAVLILLLIIPALIYAGNYFFRFNVGQVTFSSSQKVPFGVELYSWELKISSRSCSLTCVIDSIPAGKYTYKARTDGRANLSGEVLIERTNPRTIPLNWEYELTLTEPTTSTWTTTTGTIQTSSGSSRFSIDDWVTPATLGYSTGSLAQGYFITIDANESYNIVDTLAKATTTLRLPTWVILERVKRLSGSDVLVLSTRSGVFTYDLRLSRLDPLPYYQDIERDIYGRIVGVIRSDDTKTRDLLGITGTTGDILVDASEPWAPQVLKGWFDPIAQIRAQEKILVLELSSGRTLELKWEK